VPELTLRVVLLAIVLSIVLAAANAFLALKIGILTSASIPAAIISMGILRFFKNAHVLENNLVQTAASAGEAVAGGIVYTIPAMVIIGYWNHFDYWQNFWIALIGGILGVLFSIPIRRVLVHHPKLPFPEGCAIARVLEAGARDHVGLKQIVLGGVLGSLYELCQSGLKLLSGQLFYWTNLGNVVFGIGMGFSATLLGAGYLIGFSIAVSIFVGALIGWVFGIPVMSIIQSVQVSDGGPPLATLVQQLREGALAYVGIGAMLVAGIFVFLTLIKPFVNSVRESVSQSFSLSIGGKAKRTERDMPFAFVLGAIVLFAFALWRLFGHAMPMEALGLPFHWDHYFLLASVLFVVVIGFLFSAITGYFSGLVGVTATPGSAIMIATVLLAAFAIRTCLTMGDAPHITQEMLMAGAACTIYIGAMIMGAAAIANDNIQDLKVGYLLGATPWKQQLMLMLGVVCSALVIPPIIQLLFNVYGIAGVMPHPGMDPSQTLPAPPAAVMAAITKGVFAGNLPWFMMLAGGGISLLVIVINRLLKRFGLELSVLGVAIGIYLPLVSSVPLFLGGMFAYWVNKRLDNSGSSPEDVDFRKTFATIIACGVVAGAAIMEVVLAIPYAWFGSVNVLRVMPIEYDWVASAVTPIVTVVGAFLLYRYVKNHEARD